MPLAPLWWPLHAPVVSLLLAASTPCGLLHAPIGKAIGPTPVRKKIPSQSRRCARVCSVPVSDQIKLALPS